jgi:hypothetical protein
MKNYSFNIEKNKVERKFQKLKKNKVDPDNIVLNAAAFQDQLLIDMGIKKKKTIINKKAIITRNETGLTEILNKIVTKTLNEEKQTEVLTRQKKFLKNLTFAQKVGLKEINKMPLSIDEWKKLEEQTIKREDFKSTCPICLEGLYKRDTTILSCSHIFHKNCILNFEKYSNNKKCPICRSANYELKDYYKDKEYFIKNNVIIIQKSYRGFITRYNLYRSVFRNEMPKNKHLRSIYSKWKIKELTNKMCSIMERQTKESQIVIKQLVKDVKEITSKNKQMESEILKNNPHSHSHSHSDTIIDWNKIMKKRKNDNCAICLTALLNKPVYLLSCTHCFHKNCLESFEKYDNYYEKRCPICRGNYEKKETKLNNI